VAFIFELGIRLRMQRFFLVDENDTRNVSEVLNWDGQTDCVIECINNKSAKSRSRIIRLWGWVYAYTDTEHFAHHMWLFFDFSIILLSAVDVWLFSVQTDSKSTGNVSSLRVLRLIRVVRSVKLFRYFKDLYLLINGLAHAFKTISWVILLLAVIIYICGIFFTNLVGRDAYYEDHDDEAYHQLHTKFRTIPRSCFELFVISTQERWVNVGWTLVKRHFLYAAFFGFYILITHFTIMGCLFVGVIVENIQRMSTLKLIMNLVEK
jgi:hypothetical protein